MVIEINVTARDVTEEEMRPSKTFAVREEGPGGILKNRKVFLSEAEDAILKSFYMRIVQDKNELINWLETPDTITAKMTIIPATDYQPN